LDKSPDAFRTISEVADDLDVPQHVLRFWESKFHQIKPLKRGGGRRYYRPADVDLLRGIKQLLYGDGYTIKGVQKILREQGVAYAQTVWNGQDTATGETAEQSKPEQPKPEQQVKARVESSAPVPDPEASPPVSGVGIEKPGPATAKGLGKEQSRLLKAALFELSEIKLLLESAPQKP
jgi:DNA-binding transcriptional MerR regulator